MTHDQWIALALFNAYIALVVSPFAIAAYLGLKHQRKLRSDASVEHRR